MKTSFLVFTLLWTFQSLAKDYSQGFEFKNYEQALKSKNFLRFDMESTKAGMITTKFTGVVRDFQVSYQGSTEKKINNGMIKFKVGALDTDSEGRNEKMFNDCLSLTQYPQIQVSFLESFNFEEKNKLVNASIKLRGYEKKIKVLIHSKKKGNIIEINGGSIVKLSELGIPDPSIWIASVNDMVKITFRVNLKVD